MTLNPMTNDNQRLPHQITAKAVGHDFVFPEGKAMTLRDLLEQHIAFIAKARAHGYKVASYTTPCCKATLETRMPSSGKWDALTTCPHCGDMFMKITTPTEIFATQPE